MPAPEAADGHGVGRPVPLPEGTAPEVLIVVKSHGSLFSLQVRVPVEWESAVCCALRELGLHPVTWQGEGSQEARVDVFFVDRSRADSVLPSLGDWPGVTATVVELPRQDWTEHWKRFFHTRRVSRRIVIKPSWEDHQPAPGDCVVELDPGMSFGTGLHGTTQACLEFLDGLARPGQPLSFLDVGCGSGVLTIAAAKLGYREAVGLDSDAGAVAMARSNAERNGVAFRCRFLHADLAALPAGLTADVVAANLRADIQQAHGSRIAGLPGGTDAARLIVAGLLVPQYAGLCRSLERHGFRLMASRTFGEWRSGVLRRACREDTGS